MCSFEEWMRREVIVASLGSFLGGVLLLIFTPIGRLAKTWIISASIAAFSFLAGSSTVPRLLLIGLSLATALGLFAIVRQMVSRPASYMRQYREDTFFDVAWRWEYHGKVISDLRAYCPFDDTELAYPQQLPVNAMVVGVDFRSPFEFHCVTCNRRFPMSATSLWEIKDMAKRQIDRKIRSGEWVQALPKTTA